MLSLTSVRYNAWFRDGWFIFSSVSFLVILVFFVAPSFFGFQDFIQWGAMYDDRWCTVAVYDKNPHTFPDARMAIVIPGTDVRRVYSGPTHNRQTCMAQARMRCGKVSTDHWLIAWVEPEFQHVRYTAEIDLCNTAMPSLDYWFYDGK